MNSRTFLQILASIALHLLIVGVVIIFSAKRTAPETKVYQVALAEFVSAPAPAPTPVQEPLLPEPSPPEEVVVPEEPVVKPPEPVEKKISSVKKTPPPKPKEKKPPAKPARPASDSPQTAVNNGGPNTGAASPQSIGGMRRYDVDAVDQRPTISRRVKPDYPMKARRMNIEGKVLVGLVVDTSGVPVECKIVHADPQGYFEEAALQAARKTKFIPGKVKGQPVNTSVVIPFVFALR